MQSYSAYGVWLSMLAVWQSMLSVLSMHPTAATVKVKLELPSGAWPPRPSSPHATLVVVPGMSQTAAVAQNVVRNVRRMGDHPFSCVVFLYEPAQSISLGNSTSAAQVEHAGCSVVRWVGRNIIDYLKLLDADVTRGFGGGVLVCLDDDVVQFALPPFLCTARRLQLDVASPAIMGEATRPSWGLMQRREYAGAARIVTIVEILLLAPRMGVLPGIARPDPQLGRLRIRHLAAKLHGRPLRAPRAQDGHTRRVQRHPCPSLVQKGRSRRSKVVARRPRAQWFAGLSDARHGEGHASARYARAACVHPQASFHMRA